MAAYWKKWLVCTLWLVASGATAEPLLIGAEDDWAPYCERNKEGGQPRGLVPELVKVVFAA